MTGAEALWTEGWTCGAEKIEAVAFAGTRGAGDAETRGAGGAEKREAGGGKKVGAAGSGAGAGSGRHCGACGATTGSGSKKDGRPAGTGLTKNGLGFGRARKAGQGRSYGAAFAVTKESYWHVQRWPSFPQNSQTVVKISSQFMDSCHLTRRKILTYSGVSGP